MLNDSTSMSTYDITAKTDAQAQSVRLPSDIRDQKYDPAAAAAAAIEKDCNVFTHVL